jgi:hypothetical protein
MSFSFPDNSLSSLRNLWKFYRIIERASKKFFRKLFFQFLFPAFL